MFGASAAKIHSVERAGVPRLSVLAALACALGIGWLLTTDVTIACGFVAFVVLFCLVLLHPAILAPALVVLSVFMERTLQPVSITVGGRELLNFSGVVNLGLVSTIIFYVATGRVRLSQSLVTRAFALYLALVAVSLLFSTDKFMTAKSLIRISAAYCIYLITTQFVTEKHQIDRMFRTLVAVSLVPIAVGLYQVAWENHFVISRAARVHGTLRNGMSFAMYLALVLPYIFGQAFLTKAGLKKRCFFGAVFGAGLVNLVYSATRIGWGVFALAMILYAIFSNAKKLLPVVLVALVVSIILFFPFFAKAFGGLFTTDLRTYLSDNISWDLRSQDYIMASSLHIRVFIWKHMLRKLADTNILLGVGSGTWFENHDRKTMGFSLASHSDYVEVVFGTGLMGLAAYLVFRIRQVTLLARFARSGAERGIKTAVLFPCLATHIAFLGMSLTEVWQGYGSIYWLSWITFGLSESYYRWYGAQQHQPSMADEVPSHGIIL